MRCVYARYALLDAWLALLADGWRFPTYIVEPITNYRGEFAVVLTNRKLSRSSEFGAARVALEPRSPSPVAAPTTARNTQLGGVTS